MNLRIEKVSVTYNEGDPNETVGLPSVSLTLENESPIVLTGPNGCGKTTLLKVLAGILTPNCGVIEFRNGEQIFPTTTKWLKRNSFLVWQQPMAGLFHDLTLAENLALFAPAKSLAWLDPYLPSWKFKNTEKAMCKILDFYASNRGKRVSELSGGRQQRFALASSHISNRKLLLFDEPTSSLDPTAVIQTEELLKNLCRDSQAISVIVTHQTDLARKLGFKEIRFDEICDLPSVSTNDVSI